MKATNPTTSGHHRRPRRFPVCGLLAAAAPVVGFLAASVYLRYADDYPRSLDLYTILGISGPTWLVDRAHMLIGSIALAGSVLGAVALWRTENHRWLAVVGLLIDSLLALWFLSGPLGRVSEPTDQPVGFHSHTMFDEHA